MPLASNVGVVVQEYMDGEAERLRPGSPKQFPGGFFMHAFPITSPRPDCQTATDLLQGAAQGLKLPGRHLAFANVPLDEPRYMPMLRKMAAKGTVLASIYRRGGGARGEGPVSMMGTFSSAAQASLAIGHFGMVNRKGWPGQLNLCRPKSSNRNRRIICLPKRRLSFRVARLRQSYCEKRSLASKS